MSINISIPTILQVSLEFWGVHHFPHYRSPDDA